MAPDFVNRSAASGMSTGPDGMLATFNNVLRPAFPDLRVEVHDQIAEADKVTTRKTFRGTHPGAVAGRCPHQLGSGARWLARARLGTDVQTFAAHRPPHVCASRRFGDAFSGVLNK